MWPIMDNFSKLEQIADDSSASFTKTAGKFNYLAINIVFK